MKKDKIQMSESFFIAGILAVVGGFLDAYTYLLRGHVFANAQTGNIALFGVSLHRGNYKEALLYLVPIIAFAAGVIVVEVVRKKYHHQEMIHWRQGIVIFEALILIGVFFLPAGDLDVVANVSISFVAAIQVEAFRRVHGHPFASTMCTGNLRNGTEALTHYAQSGDKKLRDKGLKYYGIILLFIVGAILGSLLSSIAGARAIALCVILLVITAILMKEEYRN